MKYIKMIEALNWAEKWELAFDSFAAVWFFAVMLLVLTVFTSCSSCNMDRDLSYEHYCDSIWVANPDYYCNVLEETDEYQDYIEQHGAWWSEE